jgi:ubiquinone/menaquinone biosynthesis C-methylase UbiE
MDVNDLHPWMYPVVIGGQRVIPGVGSKQSAERLVARVEHQKKFLVDAISERYDFREKTVLDVGSNCGYWSLEYAKRGSGFTHLIEGRERAIEQGELLWQDAGFHNLRFYHADVMEINYSKFDVDFALCAGILYHVKEWELLLNLIGVCTKEGMLIETAVANEDKATREVPGHFNAIDSRLTKRIPTAGRLLSMAALYGDVEIMSRGKPKGFNMERMIIWIQKN